MTESEILATMRHFIQENFLYMKPGVILADGDSLLKKGIVDSMGVLEVMNFLEETFDVSPSNEEITEANLGSLMAIARFVAAKRSGTTA